MPEPVLLIVDSAPKTRTKKESVKEKYDVAAQVLAKDSAAEALESLRELKEHGEAVILLLVSQGIPDMDGIAFLAEAVEFFLTLNVFYSRPKQPPRILPAA